MHPVRVVMAGVLLSGAFTFGCTHRPELPGETGTVRGTVLYQGEPIPDGSTVVMVHREQGILAIGVTNRSGEFTLRMRNRPDILVGEYDVHVKPPGELDEEIGTPTMDNVPDAWKEVPEKYWNLSTSDTLYTVKSGSNTFEWVLED